MAAGSCAARAMIRSRKPGANRSSWFSIAAVMSTVEPFGTWQYAHSTCRPDGARDGSAAPGCTASTYGRSGWRPAATAASAAVISSSVPPRCTVAAAATAGSRHGTGPSSAQSSLNAPGP